MAIVRDICTGALRELGVLASGEVGNASDYEDAREALNDLLDQWKAERLMIYAITRTTFTVTAAQQDYTVGVGGDVNVMRPVYVDHVNWIDTAVSPTLEIPLTPLTDDAWAGVAQKSLTSAQSSCWYYNPTYPLGTLSLWPIPTANKQGAFYAPAAVDEFASLTTAISLPPGYRRMLVKNLAVDLASAYEKQASQDLLQEAARTKGVVKLANKRLMDMTIDIAALGGNRGRWTYNINTGY